MATPLKLLFLCTTNTSRSPYAEYAARKLGSGRFQTFSAGSLPKQRVHPIAMQLIREEFGFEIPELACKSLHEFQGTRLDFVITLCSSAHETCPVWPGQPTIAHWDLPDPETFHGTEAETVQFFREVASQIRYRIDLLCSLPLEHMMVNRLKLTQSVRDIGKRI